MNKKCLSGFISAKTFFAPWSEDKTTFNTVSQEHLALRRWFFVYYQVNILFLGAVNL
jgi:hypothetical protein